MRYGVNNECSMYAVWCQQRVFHVCGMVSTTDVFHVCGMVSTTSVPCMWYGVYYELEHSEFELELEHSQ